MYSSTISRKIILQVYTLFNHVICFLTLYYPCSLAKQPKNIGEPLSTVETVFLKMWYFIIHL